MQYLPSLTSNVAYLALLFALIVIPRTLQRFRLPAPLTSFALGMLAAALLGAGYQDPTLTLLATLGISSLFLFAGLEVDLDSLKRGRWPLISHLILRAIVTAGAAALGVQQLNLDWRVAALIALALLTPSTGFILDSLPRLGLSQEEREWVTIKAIGGEILALAILFGVLQSDSAAHLALASLELAAMVVCIPVVLGWLVRLIAPYAPGSEFSLLVMVGIISAYLTDSLGVHYLVGAFLAGFIARLLRRRMPALASDTNLRAIQMFASFFVPFYFFFAGMGVPSASLSWAALTLGLQVTVAVLPFRIAVIWLQRRFIKDESARSSLNVATALSPTLIFTMVLATILRDRFHISDVLYGALLVYAAITTMLPSLFLARPPDFSAYFHPTDVPEPPAPAD